MALVDDKARFSWGVVVQIIGVVFVLGGGWAQFRAQGAEIASLQARVAKLTEVDHETALRLVKFDATLENLTRATEELSREVRGLRGVRTARGRE